VDVSKVSFPKSTPGLLKYCLLFCLRGELLEADYFRKKAGQSFLSAPRISTKTEAASKSISDGIGKLKNG
jgi:hypothetical protein